MFHLDISDKNVNEIQDEILSRTNTVIFNYQNGGFDGHNLLYYELFFSSDDDHLINVTNQTYDTYKKLYQ